MNCCCSLGPPRPCCVNTCWLRQPLTCTACFLAKHVYLSVSPSLTGYSAACWLVLHAAQATIRNTCGCACVDEGGNHKCVLMRAGFQALTAIRLPCRAVSCPQFAFDGLQAACTWVADTILGTMLPLIVLFLRAAPSERAKASEGNPQVLVLRACQTVAAGAAGTLSRM